MQILKQNYLSPGFQIKQSQMLKSVQTPLFLIIPILEKLLKNSMFTSALPRIIENFNTFQRISE